MAEYIDREEAINAVLSCFGVEDSIFSDATVMAIGFKLKDIPAADVQPVVRCINCKYYEGLACCKLIGDCGGTNWFCGWGEPKEE